MTASPQVGFTNAVSLTVKKGASAASLTFKRFGDGSFEFTDVAGNTHRVSASNIAVGKLWAKINSLV